MSEHHDGLRNRIKKVGIVYFSGTGGTKRVADCFEKQLVDKGMEVKKIILDRQQDTNTSSYECEQDTDMLILLFPVYAMDAPGRIYDWITGSSDVKGVPAVVISVSGGGEVFPNTACRVGCIKTLENKGYDVVYERMLVMPSNIFIGIHDHLAMCLLQVLPLRVERIVSDILSGASRRTKPKISSTIMVKAFSNYEKKTVKEFGRYFHVDESCTECGWCANNCPNMNIEMENGRPTFKKNCTACLRCLYGCPSNSILMKKYEAFTVKEGYDLDALERRMKGVELEPAEKFCKGIAWIGVRKYLFEDDI